MGEKREIGMGLSMGANDYTIKGSSNPKEVLDKVQEILSARTADNT
jgi:DNA-binding response OmpR family regulator